MTGFRSTLSTPPGGEWFWDDGDAFIHSRSYQDAVDALARHFREKGVAKDPAVALAEYMCARMPPGFCRGAAGSREPTLAELVEATRAACDGRPLADAVTIQRRLEACAACGKCTRPVCVPCRGVDAAVYGFFGGRRPPVPADRKSGVCSVFGAFAMGLASVDGAQATPSGDVPDACWRNKR